MVDVLYYTSRSLSRSILREARNTFRKSSTSQDFHQVRTIGCLRRSIYSCSTLDSTISKLSQQCFNVQWIHFRKIQYSPILCSDMDVVVPPFAISVSEGDVKWEKNVGDSVAEDETVCEIETDKTAIAVPAPGNGVIEEHYVEDGTTVRAGQKLFRMKLGG